MRLNFLGNGSAFYPLYGNTCAYFVNEKELYLIDCGETAFSVLCRQVDLDKIEKVYVIITHLHADHVGSLGTLISYFYCLHGIRIRVIHPEKSITRLLELEGIGGDDYVYLDRLPENSADLKAEPIEVRHVTNMKCFGYLLQKGDTCIYYSGDSAELPETVRESFLAGKIEAIYQDTSTHDSSHSNHCYYGKLEKAIPAEKRGQVFCMHLDSPCEEILRAKGFQIAEVKKL